jgi:hypothetical protein
VSHDHSSERYIHLLDVDRLGGRVIAQGVLAQLLPNATRLVSAKRSIRKEHVQGVDPDNAGLELSGNPEDSLRVFREDIRCHVSVTRAQIGIGKRRTRKSVRAIVCQSDDLFLAAEPADTKDRSKDLVLIDQCFGIGVHE